MGFPKIRGTILGVPIVRTIVYWGSILGSPILGNYHMSYGLNLGWGGSIGGCIGFWGGPIKGNITNLVQGSYVPKIWKRQTVAEVWGSMGSWLYWTSSNQQNLGWGMRDGFNTVVSGLGSSGFWFPNSTRKSLQIFFNRI